MKLKNKKRIKRTNSRIIAEVVGCSSSTVRQVANGDRSAETSLGQRIAVATMILEDGIEGIIINAKKTLQNAN